MNLFSETQFKIKHVQNVTITSFNELLQSLGKVQLHSDI